jgi:hypothetical protein
VGSDDSGEKVGAGVVLGADGGGVHGGGFVGAERVAIGGAHGSKGARPVEVRPGGVGGWLRAGCGGFVRGDNLGGQFVPGAVGWVGE